MSLPVSSQAIYDLLIADATIAAALGTYTLADGTTMPAISVLSANEQLPPGTTVNGIEVVISGKPGFAPKLLLTAEVLTNPTWRVYIMGWQTIVNLQAVAERVFCLLPGAAVSTIQGDGTASDVPGEAPGEGIGIIDQVVVTWTNPCVAVTQ